MQVTSGLMDHAVLQRRSGDMCDTPVSGRCATRGTIQMRVTKSGKAVRGLSWHDVGRARGTTFTARVRGIAVGGPYDIQLRLKDAAGSTADALVVRDVLVGDLWILAGQSNMQGCGDRENAHRSHGKVRAFYMDDRWATAEDPLHNMWQAVDPVHEALAGGRIVEPVPPLKDVGPGVAFGVRMHKVTGLPQGLIACAHGGTCMTQWEPALLKKGGGSLYGATMRRVRRNGGSVAGVVWYQGESDAGEPAASLYGARMRALIAAFRRDMKCASLPLVLVQLARTVGVGRDCAAWNSIQEQQRLLPDQVKHVATVPAIDLGLDDMIHVGGISQQLLGTRLADAMHTLKGGDGALPPPIRLKHICVANNPKNPALGDVVVEFENVVGSLQSQGRPSGFSLSGEGAEDAIYRTELNGCCAILLTGATRVDLTHATVTYGRDCNPYCNVRDEAGRAVAVFGPRTIGRPRALSPFVQALRVSGARPGAGTLEDVECPGDGVRYRRKKFPTRFCDMHPEIGASRLADPLHFYACDIECSEPMRLACHLGYDGPVKAWIDGHPALHDPTGTNPAVPDEVSIPFKAGAGRHEILVALGSNRKAAWGVFLRFERLDVKPSAVAKGAGAYVMPKVLG